MTIFIPQSKDSKDQCKEVLAPINNNFFIMHVHVYLMTSNLLGLFFLVGTSCSPLSVTMWQLTSPSPWPATTMTTPTQWPLSPMRSAPAGMDEGLAIREEAASSHRAVGWHGEVSSINYHTRVGVGTGILNMHFSLCRKYIDLMFWLCRSTNLAVGSSKPLLCINVYWQHVHDMHV